MSAPLAAQPEPSSSTEDLSAVFAYIRTLKPIRNEVPQPLPPPAAPTAERSAS